MIIVYADSALPLTRRVTQRLTSRAHRCYRNTPGKISSEPAWKAMYRSWSDPQPNSLAWRESPALESTFAARYMPRCTAIGVSATARHAPPLGPHSIGGQGESLLPP